MRTAMRASRRQQQALGNREDRQLGAMVRLVITIARDRGLDVARGKADDECA